VARVNYPFLASHPQHAKANQLFKGGSWLLSFELADAADCLPFINRLQIPVKGTGLADTRSLVIPVAHTIFWEAGADIRAQMGIGDGLIRYSVGLEDLADLQADLAQALAQP
jgi:O-acetylhomoserine (thiol)-lyase